MLFFIKSSFRFALLLLVSMALFVRHFGDACTEILKACNVEVLGPAPLLQGTVEPSPEFLMYR